jgi:hypothetical protein
MVLSVYGLDGFLAMEAEEREEVWGEMLGRERVVRPHFLLFSYFLPDEQSED